MGNLNVEHRVYLLFNLKLKSDVTMDKAEQWIKDRSAKYRPLYRQFVWLFFANVILLGYLGAQTADGLFLIIGRIATVYYFAHFIIILPLLGYIEKTKPLPKSLSEPVLSPEERQMKVAASGASA